jgi:large subunit ribosomal protein L22
MVNNVSNDRGAVLKCITTSPKKMHFIAGLVRGMDVAKADHQLAFCKKDGAKYLRNLLKSSVANAENNYGLDVSTLYISHIYVGKSMMLQRFMACGRGRSARIKKLYSKVRIVLGVKDKSNIKKSN